MGRTPYHGLLKEELCLAHLDVHLHPLPGKDGAFPSLHALPPHVPDMPRHACAKQVHMNHSCGRANVRRFYARAKGRVAFFAVRDIEPGEELLFE